MSLTGIAPMLQVDDINDTIRYYVEVLGFRCSDQMGNDWARLERDGVAIMLSARYGNDQNEPPKLTGSIYIYTDAVDTLWEALQGRTTVSYPIETFDYGMREFAILDCNGYMLQFGQVV